MGRSVCVDKDQEHTKTAIEPAQQSIAELGQGPQVSTSAGLQSEELLQFMGQPTGVGGVSDPAAAQSQAAHQANGQVVQLSAAPGVGGNPAPSPAPAADPTWAEWLDSQSLPADISTKAKNITDAADRDAFKTLTETKHKRAFVKLPTSKLKQFFMTSPLKEKLVLLTQTPESLDSPKQSQRFADNLVDADPAVQSAFLNLDPDERHGLLQSQKWAHNLKKMVAGNTLQQWRNDRLLELFKLHPDFCAEINTAGSETWKDALLKACTGEAANRLKRIVEDKGFRDESVKWEFINEFIGLARTNPGITSFWGLLEKAIWGPQKFIGRFINKGKKATKGPPVLKAIPLTDFGHPKWGHTMQPATMQNFFHLAGSSIPMQSGAPDVDAIDAQLPPLIAQHGATLGFRPHSHMLSSTISGPMGVGYWMIEVADATGLSTALKVETDRSSVVNAVAVDESPAYNDGFLIAQLTNRESEALVDSMKITRPTAIDGIRFAQYLPVEDETQCYGVTSGGAPEVAVGAVPLGSTTEINLFYK